ncbi:hypothetical protein LZ30DRAFT_714191 [Colletotrichum cereale]|nr:hypothetical protein LZ30DRAFT_714191 [Colletotrichum cereale]
MSSYWSVAEADNFPSLLKSFGTNWAAIARHMGSKTPVMVKNYFVRKTEYEKTNWKQLVFLADSRRKRGEKLPVPPPPNVGGRRIYDSREIEDDYDSDIVPFGRGPTRRTVPAVNDPEMESIRRRLVSSSPLHEAILADNQSLNRILSHGWAASSPANPSRSAAYASRDITKLGQDSISRAPDLALKPRPGTSLISRTTIVHATISKDHTDSDSVRQAKLFAAFGQRMHGCPPKIPHPVRKEALDHSDDDNDGIFSTGSSTYPSHPPQPLSSPPPYFYPPVASNGPQRPFARSQFWKASRSPEHRSREGYMYDPDDVIHEGRLGHELLMQQVPRHSFTSPDDVFAEFMSSSYAADTKRSRSISPERRITGRQGRRNAKLAMRRQQAAKIPASLPPPSSSRIANKYNKTLR